MIQTRRHEDIIESLPFRIFCIELDDSVQYWVHRFKDGDLFKKDLSTYRTEYKDLDARSVTEGLPRFLEKQGYINVACLVSEDFKGEVISTKARIIEKD